jgi:NAD(P)-dependent dehydrogenase (short-subunit alcohol dehydrogenase family)
VDQLEGRVAVVTGAASGIGLALATRLASEGMQLVLGDVEAPALEAAATALRDAGAHVEALVTDVSVASEVDALGRAAMERFGALHLAVNNAGVSGGGLSWEIPLETWDWILGVNLRGVIHGVRAFVPRIIESGGGHVVNTASMAGLTSPPFMGPYNVSKHGVVTLSETLYQELQLTHPEVGVTVVCPGWVRTRIHEADRNRPAGVPGPPVGPEAGTEAGAGFRDIVTSLIEGGLDPAEVARMIVAAVRSGRCYVLTHDGWAEMARTRMDRIVSGENPAVTLPAVD